jgi:hypothetical protein
MPTIRPLKPDDQRLRAYAAEYLDCRNLGHVWHTIGFFQGEGVIKRRLSCSRCETERTDRWEHDGSRRAGSYNYAEGYRLEGMQPATTQVRLELMRRATIYKTEAEMLAAMTNGARR